MRDPHGDADQRGEDDAEQNGGPPAQQQHDDGEDHTAKRQKTDGVVESGQGRQHIARQHLDDPAVLDIGLNHVLAFGDEIHEMGVL